MARMYGEGRCEEKHSVCSAVDGNCIPMMSGFEGNGMKDILPYTMRMNLLL
jgi:hypothetical protein